MKYSIALVLALAAVASSVEVPKRIEKRGIYGGLPLGTYGLGGIPLGLAAPITAPIAPLGLGLHSPLIASGLPLGGVPLSYGLGGLGGLPLSYGLGGLGGYGLPIGGLGLGGIPAIL